jgi:hypothetical protein
MTSLALRHNVPVKFVIDQLQKINGQYIYSIPNTLTKALMPYVNEGNDEQINLPEENLLIEESFVEEKINVSVTGANKCPSCGENSYILEEGCGHCLNCGYSKCG